MLLAKTKLMTLVELMNDDDAESLLKYIASKYVLTKKVSWDDIEEVEPDDFDLAMLQSIKTDPDCHEFIPASEIDWNNLEKYL